MRKKKFSALKFVGKKMPASCGRRGDGLVRCAVQKCPLLLASRIGLASLPRVWLRTGLLHQSHSSAKHRPPISLLGRQNPSVVVAAVAALSDHI